MADTIADYVSRLASEAPPLDDAQRAVILSAFDGHLPSTSGRPRAA